MSQSINLIPKTEQQEQRKVKIVKMSSVFSVLILLVVVGISAYFWNESNQLKNDVKKTNEEIEAKRKDITNLSDIEVASRTLDAKYVILNEIFNERKRYSLLLDELDKRIPSGTIELQTLGFSGESQDQMNLSGKGSDYIAISNFLDTLSNQEYAGGNENLGPLFKDVTLNSVNLNSQSLDVTYYIITNYDVSLIN